MASAIVHGLIDQQHYTLEQIACTCGDDPTVVNSSSLFSLARLLSVYTIPFLWPIILFAPCLTRQGKSVPESAPTRHYTHSRRTMQRSFKIYLGPLASTIWFPKNNSMP
jgi:hypothetical protein